MAPFRKAPTTPCPLTLHITPPISENTPDLSSSLIVPRTLNIVDPNQPTRQRPSGSRVDMRESILFLPIAVAGAVGLMSVGGDGYGRHRLLKGFSVVEVEKYARSRRVRS
jgi:hypothetical protein